MKRVLKLLLLSLLVMTFLVCLSIPAHADVSDGNSETSANDTDGTDTGFFGNADTLKILISLTLISLIPTILIMTTCFTRIIIVLSLLRNAVGLQQTPPNQVLIGIALFLTLFIMSPVISRIDTEAYQPYKAGEITEEKMLENAVVPMREFMLKQTKNEDLNFFLDISNSERPESLDDIPTLTIIPAFITSELKRAFLMGFMLYLPFLVIDIVVSSTLMSMGMVMLPPAMISMPFKLMLFVLVDGWQLTFQTLVTSFN